MNYYLIAPAKTFHSSDNLLTYASDVPLQPGHVVEIPLGRQTTVGIVKAATSKPEFETKPILRLIAETPLPKPLTKAIFWLSDYYRCPLSTAVQAALPRGITKQRRTPKPTATEAHPRLDNPLNSAQLAAIEQIEQSSANTTLLHGITGSGKTNIYIELTRRHLAQGECQKLLSLLSSFAISKPILMRWPSFTLAKPKRNVTLSGNMHLKRLPHRS